MNDKDNNKDNNTNADVLQPEESNVICKFCNNKVPEVGFETTYYKGTPRKFRCTKCPKTVTYFYNIKDLELKSPLAITIWTTIKEKDIVYFTSYITKTSTVDMVDEQCTKLKCVVEIPFDTKITPENIDRKVPIYITFS